MKTPNTKLTAAVAAVALATAGSAHAQEVPVDDPCPTVESRGHGLFVGMVSDQVFADPDPDYRRCALNEHAELGVRIIRVALLWKDLEVRRNRFDWAHWDDYVGAVAQHDIRLMPIIYDPPRWRQQRRKRPDWGTIPPKRRAIKRFAATLVRRYGPDGRFWRANPEVPHVPIRVWQIWNEPNLARYWAKRPDARQYVRMLRAASRAIKRRDRRAKVVAAGMPDSGLWRAVPLRRYVKQMYRAGAKGTFDALAVNGYADSPRTMMRTLADVRTIMRDNRDRSGIWITELGWGTGGPKYRFRVTRKQQAKLLRRSLRLLRKQRHRLGIEGFVHYMWQDAPPYGDTGDFWGLHTGLLDLSGREKPAYRVFRRLGRKLRWVG